MRRKQRSCGPEVTVVSLVVVQGLVWFDMETNGHVGRRVARWAVEVRMIEKEAHDIQKERGGKNEEGQQCREEKTDCGRERSVIWSVKANKTAAAYIAYSFIRTSGAELLWTKLMLADPSFAPTLPLPIYIVHVVREMQRENVDPTVLVSEMFRFGTHT